MNARKVALSILAAVVGIFGTTTALGEWLVPRYVSELALALGGVLGSFGVQPFSFPPTIARALTAAAWAVSVLVASHAGNLPMDAGRSVAWTIVGVAGVLLGVLGRSVTQRTPEPTPATA